MKVTIVLTAHEAVVQRGTERVTWLVHHSGEWLSARDVPGVELTQLDTGPGTIWETSAEMSLEPGSWLMQIRRRPRGRGFADPMRYLEGEVRRAREHVAHQYFVVGPRGQLARPPKGAEPPPHTDSTDRNAT